MKLFWGLVSVWMTTWVGEGHLLGWGVCLLLAGGPPPPSLTELLP